MSIQAVAWVLEHSEATLADRLVLIAIANHANAQGLNAWPSASQIAREARVDRRTVQRAILDLEALGEVNVIRRPGRPSQFSLRQIAPGQGENVGQDAPGERGTSRPRGGTSTPKRWGKSPPEPSVTVQEPSRAHARATLPPELPADVKARGAEFFRALRKGEAT